MFEHRSKPLLSRRTFYRRLARSVGIAIAIVLFSLGLGSAGYHHFSGLPWIDALLNAAMILTGMGCEPREIDGRKAVCHMLRPV